MRNQHASSPNKPIYLVGDSFGGCLALAVAARNPAIDLVLVLANPGISKYTVHHSVLFRECLLSKFTCFMVTFVCCHFFSATSFNRSQLQSLLPFLEAIPNELHFTIPYLLIFVLGKFVLVRRISVFL